MTSDPDRPSERSGARRVGALAFLAALGMTDCVASTEGHVVAVQLVRVDDGAVLVDADAERYLLEGVRASMAGLRLVPCDPTETSMTLRRPWPGPAVARAHHDVGPEGALEALGPVDLARLGAAPLALPRLEPPPGRYCAVSLRLERRGETPAIAVAVTDTRGRGHELLRWGPAELVWPLRSPEGVDAALALGGTTPERVEVRVELDLAGLLEPIAVARWVGAEEQDRLLRALEAAAAATVTDAAPP